MNPSISNLSVAIFSILLYCLPSDMFGQNRIALTIPESDVFEVRLPVGIEDRTFTFEPFNIYQDGLELKLNDQPSGLNLPRHYRAVGANMVMTVFAGKVSISGIFGKNELRISPNGDYYYGRTVDEGPFCDVDESYIVDDLPEAASEAATGECLLVEYHVSQAAYYDFDNDIMATIQYISDLMVQSHLLYANESVILTASELSLWTEENPWFEATYSSSSAGLADMSAYVVANGLNGNIAHLLHLQVAMGGVAYVGGGNPASSLATSVAFSGIRNTFSDYPTYSWSVMVLAHEMGHSFGSRHTHNCSWGINGDASIDRCGPENGYSEGSCTAATSLYNLPEGGGSVMSYCHLDGVGMNLESGFLTGIPGSDFPILPGDKIRSARDNWGFVCNVNCAVPINLTATTTQNSMTVNWSGDGPFIATLGSDTIETNSPPVTFSGLQPSTQYTASVVSVCGEEQSTAVTVTAVTLCSSYQHVPNYVADMSEDTWGKGERWIFNDAADMYEQQQTQSSNHLHYYQYLNTSLISPCFESNGEQFGRLKVQIGGGSESHYDYMVLEMSKDQNTWQKIGEFPDFYSYENVYGGETSAWSGVYPTQMLEMDISEHMGGNLAFRFRFKSDGINAFNGGPEVTYFEIQGPEGGNCDSTVYDTTTVIVLVNDTVPVFDTTQLCLDTAGCDSLNGVITALQGEIVVLTGTVMTLQNEVAVLEGEVVTLENEVTELNGIIDSLLALECDTVYVPVPGDTLIYCPPDECSLSAVIPECASLFTVGRPSVTLTALPVGGTPPYSFTWSHGVTVQNAYVTAPGSYSVTITDAEGCEATATKDVVLIDNNCSPNPVRLGNKAYMCKGGSTECVNVNQIDTYLAQGWTLGACGTDPCINYESRTRISSPDGIMELLKIFPNPTSGKIKFLYSGDWKAEAEFDGLSVVISDNLGREIYNGEMLREIEIDGPAGAYTINVINRFGYCTYSTVIVKN